MKIQELTHLTTQRLQLRPVRMADAPVMFAYMSDPAVAKWLSGQAQTDISQTENGIKNYFLADPTGKWALTRQDDDTLMGTIDLRVDEHNRTAEIGYVLAPEFQGNGYVTEATAALVEVSFTKLALGRVWIGHDVLNARSAGVPQRLGFVREGILRNDHFQQGLWRDTVIWSKIPTD